MGGEGEVRRKGEGKKVEERERRSRGINEREEWREDSGCPRKEGRK
jgi:hypothetical protein